MSNPSPPRTPMMTSSQGADAPGGAYTSPLATAAMSSAFAGNAAENDFGGDCGS